MSKEKSVLNDISKCTVLLFHNSQLLLETICAPFWGVELRSFNKGRSLQNFSLKGGGAHLNKYSK